MASVLPAHTSEITGHYTVWGDAERLLGNVERLDTREEPGTLGEER